MKKTMAKKKLTPYEQLVAACRTPQQIVEEQKKDPKTNQWYVAIGKEDDDPYMVDCNESTLNPEDTVIMGPVTQYEAECGLQREFSLRGE